MFILGTANFGNVYQGSTRVIDLQSAYDLVKEFIRLGGHQLDTADAYGDSKKILQKLNYLKFNVGTKIDSKKLLSLDIITDYLTKIERQFEKKLNYILLHDCRSLCDTQEKPLKFLQNYLNEKNIKLGISIYNERELDLALNRFEDISIVQAPLNYLDRRFVSDSFLKICSINNIEINYRSIFLQGKLLSEYDLLHPYFQDFNEIKEYFSDFSASPFKSLLQFNIEYIRSQIDFSKVVLGVETIPQLYEIHSILSPVKDYPKEHNYRIINFNENLCIPMNWKLR